MTAIAPKLSVLLPLQDDRGLAPEAVASWTQGQRCDSADHELLILFPPALAARAASVKPLLRECDRMIEHDGNEMVLYNLGAELARAPGLFFTEAHCIAEPDSVSSAIAALQSGEAGAYCGHSTPLARNTLAKLDAALFTEDFAECMKPDHFGKVMLRALIMPRQDFLAAGGLSVPHYRFADWLLAARLHSRGYRIASAPGIRLAHLYAERFEFLTGFIRDFVEGECLLRREPAEAEFCRRYFGDPPAWRRARNFDPQAARHAFASLLRQTFTGRGIPARMRAQGMLELTRRVPAALCGRRMLTGGPRWRVRIGQLGSLCPLFPVPLRLHFFTQFWRSTTDLWRAHYALQAPGPRAVPAQHARSLLTESAEGALDHLNPWEQWQSERFRWSASCCQLRLPACDRRQALTLELAAFTDGRTIRDARFWLNGEILAHAVRERDGRPLLQVEVPPLAQPAWLYWLAPEHGRRGSETRSLGLPLREAKLEIALRDPYMGTHGAHDDLVQPMRRSG
ncbi:MAG: hypothetical protein WDZ63_17625 [Burkholderiales bacterium]